MRARLEGGSKRAPSPALSGSLALSKSSHEIVLGVDPSLRGTGYGIIRLGKPHPITLTHGTIHCPAGWEHSRCLVKIAQTVREQIQKFKPTVCAMEGLFFAQNLQTALIMGEARGASLVTAAEAGLEIFEISPRKVKQAIVGHGEAQKLAVAKMVQRLLHLVEVPEPDAADALALALAFAQESSRYPLRRRRRFRDCSDGSGPAIGWRPSLLYNGAENVQSGVDHLPEEFSSVKNAFVIGEILASFGEMRSPGLLDPFAAG